MMAQILEHQDQECIKLTQNLLVSLNDVYEEALDRNVHFS